MAQVIIVDVQLGWHRDFVIEHGAPLDPGVLRQLSRSAREILYAEWNVLENRVQGADVTDQGRGHPAVAVSVDLTAEEALWFRELLDRLWAERAERHQRARLLRAALVDAADRLLRDLNTTDAFGVHSGVDATVVATIVRKRARIIKDRARDRAESADVQRSVRELVAKMRLSVWADLFLQTAKGQAIMTAWTQQALADPEVRGAWELCDYRDVPPPPVQVPDAEDQAMIPAELCGRVVSRNVMLMIDPHGPVKDRPLPPAVLDGLGTIKEETVVQELFRAEVRRATFPAGLMDRTLRAQAVLATLFVDARWTAGKVATVVTAARAKPTDVIRAVRALGRVSPSPGSLDLLRCGAVLQHQDANSAPVEAARGGWDPELAGHLFDGLTAYRFAVPVSVALETAVVTPCGAWLPERFSAKHRAGRVDEPVEKLMQEAVSNYRRGIQQRLLKEDQAGTANLRLRSAPEWNKEASIQLRQEAKDVEDKYATRRPRSTTFDESIHPGSRPENDVDVAALTDLQQQMMADPLVLDIFQVGDGSPDLLAELVSEWNRLHPDSISREMRYRIRDLFLFVEWLRNQFSRPGSAFARELAEPALRGERSLLRQALHRYVCTESFRPGGAVRERSPAARQRAEQRDSRLLHDAVELMVRDVAAAQRLSRNGDER